MPQTIAVLTTKASGLDIEIVIGNHETMQLDNTFYGALLQYPGKNGVVVDYTDLISTYKTLAIQVAVACDPLALVKLKSPAEMGLIVLLVHLSVSVFLWDTEVLMQRSLLVKKIIREIFREELLVFPGYVW